MLGTRCGPFTVLWLDPPPGVELPIGERAMKIEAAEPNYGGMVLIPGPLRARLAEEIRPATRAEVEKALDAYASAVEERRSWQEQEAASQAAQRRRRLRVEAAQSVEGQRRAALLALIGGSP